MARSSPPPDGRSDEPVPGRPGWRAGRRRGDVPPDDDETRAVRRPLPPGGHPRRAPAPSEDPTRAAGPAPSDDKTRAARPAYHGPRLRPTRVEGEPLPPPDPRGHPGRAPGDLPRADAPAEPETVELGHRERGSRRPRDLDDDPGPAQRSAPRRAAWRTGRLTRQGARAFHRAASADGADRSGLTALTYAWMANYASDATLAVALANTLFFSAASAESKDKVALYLLITVAPFALIAPVIGPLLDRIQSGRRVALAASTAGQGVLAVVLALFTDTWVLYPAALGIMVLSKSFGVLKAAVTPRVLPAGITLVKTNSRLTVFGLVASGAAGAVAVGVSWAFGSSGAAWLTAVICGSGVWLCLRIPSWVEVTEGEVSTTLLPHTELHRTSTPDAPTGAKPAAPRVAMSPRVVTALWANGTIRSLTGFLMLFAAFVVKNETVGSPGSQLVLLGLVGAAAGAGGFLGNAIGARQDFAQPSRLVVGCLCAALASTVLAALVVGLATAALVGLVGATVSALLKVCLDAVVQRDMPEASRASAFGRSETILQLSWVFGGALGVLLPPTWWIGFTVIAGILAVGTVQTVMISRGSSLLPSTRASA